MKSWRLDPILGEPIKRKDSEEYSDFSLQVERAALRSSGAIAVTYQLWNEQPHLTRSCAPSIKKELAEACQDILAVAPDLDPVDLSRVLAKLEVDAGQQEPRSRADAADEAPREQPSLSPPGFICVALDEEGQQVYVVRTAEGSTQVVPSVVGPYKGEQVTHVPPPDLPWVLPRAAAVLEHYERAGDDGWAARLLEDLEGWHKAASDLGRREAYLLLALYDLLTYIPEHTDYYAEIALEAEPERGKTRTGQAAIYVCRHGVHLQGIREATLLRDASDLGASLFIDVMNLSQTLERKECIDVVLARFEKGGSVERVQYPERGAFLDTVRYVVYGPTIIATNEPIHRILDTRCLRIDMPLTKQRFKGRIEPEAARDLVERLMAWRAVMLGCTLPECAPPAHGRLGDILRPLRRVLRMVAPAREKEFEAIVSWQQKRRHDDLAQSSEAGIIKAVVACKPEVRDGWLAVSAVVEQFNSTRGDKPVPANWLGRKVRKMGWTVERIGHDNVTSLLWDEDLLERLQLRYGLLDEQAEQQDQTQKEECPRTPEHASHASHTSQSRGAERDACDAEARYASHAGASHTSHVDARSTGDGPRDATHATHATQKSECAGSGADERTSAEDVPQQAPLWEAEL
jgi:hypothetical protein